MCRRSAGFRVVWCSVWHPARCNVFADCRDPTQVPFILQVGLGRHDVCLQQPTAGQCEDATDSPLAPPEGCCSCHHGPRSENAGCLSAVRDHVWYQCRHLPDLICPSLHRKKGPGPFFILGVPVRLVKSTARFLPAGGLVAIDRPAEPRKIAKIQGL